jgi:hypothetical protein
MHSLLHFTNDRLARQTSLTSEIASTVTQQPSLLHLQLTQLPLSENLQGPLCILDEAETLSSRSNVAFLLAFLDSKLVCHDGLSDGINLVIGHSQSQLFRHDLIRNSEKTIGDHGNAHVLR